MRFNRIPAGWLYASVVVAAGLTSGSASAQATDPTSDPASQVDDVIVTAQKRGERAVDVPASLTVIGGEDLQKGGAVTTLDLTAQVPGLTMDRNGLTTAPALRGVTSIVAGPGLDANVATYIDGVYSSQTGALLDLPDVESIVVLKGPQGTLFGRNATGGAIQITTLTPSFSPTGNATVTYGRFNSLSARGFLSGPLIADRLAASVAVYSETSDGYLRDIIGGGRVGGLDASLIRGKLLYTPTPGTALTLTAYYSEHSDPANSQGSVIDNITAANLQPGSVVPSRPYDVAFNRLGVASSEGRGVSLTGAFDIAGGVLNVIAAYDENETYGLNPGYYAFAPGGGNYFDVLQTDERTSVEVNFVSRQYGRFNYIAGLYYYDNTGAYDPLQLRNDVPARVISIFGYQTAESYAAFGEINLDLTDRLTLTAGLRYSTEDRGIRGFSCVCDIPQPTGPLVNFGDVSFDAWTPRLSLRYAISDAANLYATYSEGFKSGGYAPSTVFGNAPPLTPVQPEELKAWEVGIKTPLGPHITLDASLFYYDYGNQQVSSFVERNGVTQSVIDNAAESTIRGAELQATYYATDDLSFHTGVALTRGRFESYPTAVVNIPRIVNGVPVGSVGVTQDLEGNALPRTPDWTVSIGAEYDRDFEPGRLLLKADLFRSDKYYFDAGNLYAQPAYTNLDASAAFSPSGAPLTFTVWGRNLTDAVKASGSFIAGSASAYFWSPPRTYGVSISARF